MSALGWTVTLACLAALAWVHAGYPLLLLLQSRWRLRPVARGACAARLSLIVPVRDGEDVVAAKLRDCLEQRLEPERLELILASDGSRDGTVAVARRFEPRVLVLDLPRQGKAAALNEAARRAGGEILAFSDVSIRLEPDALRLLLENFADPSVGGACARQLVEVSGAESGEALGEGWYWRFDQWLKRAESATGSVFAADGGLHALRRELHVPIGEPAQADDMALSMRVVTQGRRLVWDERAVARETRPAALRAGFARKARIAAHSVNAIRLLGRQAWTQGEWSLRLLSHKLLRHLVPVFLLGSASGASILALRGSRAGLALLAAQAAFLALGLTGLLLGGTRLGRARALSAPAFFLRAHAASLVGLLTVASGRATASWRPSAGRSGPERRS